MQLASRNLAQVSINLTDYRKTTLKDVYDKVKKLAAENGAAILESELIGLAPEYAFAGVTPQYLKLNNFDENRLIETQIKKFTG